MKKLFALLLAFTMIAVIGVPAFASEQPPIFDVSFARVENEPTVGYDEWDIPYNIWTPMADEASVTPGETVTMALTYTVPAQVPGYNPELLSSIHITTDLHMFDHLELVEAQGCPDKVNCDYEIGICVPVFGEYANVELIELNGCTLDIWAELGSTVIVVVRGTAPADFIEGTTKVDIGQCSFPAHFSIGIVDNLGNTPNSSHYNVHWSDTIFVKKCSVEFRPGNTFVALNNHYHRMETNGSAPTAFIPVDDNFQDSGAPIDTGSELFADLADIFAQVHNFFGIGYDQTNLTDADFLGNAEHYTFNYPYRFGAKNDVQPTVAPVDPTTAPVDPTTAPADPTTAPVDPTTAPVDPTTAPVDPTDVPVDPTDVPADPTDAPADPTAEPTTAPKPNAPSTGAMSIVLFGAASVAAGATMIISRKKED